MKHKINKQKIISTSIEETKEFASSVLQELLDKNRDKALVIGLSGELGSGKTQFTQGVARGLGIKRNITSPTFVIMKRYGNFYHFDCYRLHSPEEIKELGWENIISNPKNIIVVEWAEKIEDIMPADAIRIKFQDLGEGKRELKIT